MIHSSISSCGWGMTGDRRQRCPGLMLGTEETMEDVTALKNTSPLSLVYISSCFPGTMERMTLWQEISQTMMTIQLGQQDWRIVGSWPVPVEIHFNWMRTRLRASSLCDAVVMLLHWGQTLNTVPDILPTWNCGSHWMETIYFQFSHWLTWAKVEMLPHIKILNQDPGPTFCSL